MACLVVSRVFQETSIVYANSLLSVNAFQTSRRTHAESTALPNAARGGTRQATTWRLIGVIYFGSLSSDSNEKPLLLLQHLWRGQNCWELLSPLHCSCMAQNRASHAPKLERKNLSDK